MIVQLNYCCGFRWNGQPREECFQYVEEESDFALHQVGPRCHVLG